DLIDKKALGSIRLCLAPSVAFNITKVKMTEELMQTLAKLYEKPSASNKVFLMKRLFNMKMKKGGSISCTKNFKKGTLLGRLEAVENELRQTRELFKIEIAFNALNI
ncbi:hypothetical protein, partial [Enterobacter hormaechei]|uniref:hypothetical protein n=1 Tax=Enterobacter hormaechei TaxID=158836 RepID=UPI0023E47448